MVVIFKDEDWQRFEEVTIPVTEEFPSKRNQSPEQTSLDMSVVLLMFQ